MSGDLGDAEHEPPSRPFPDPEHSIAPRKPRTLGGAVYLAVLAVTFLGLAMILLEYWRTGLTVIGGAMLCGALARLVLRDADAGMLRLRRKAVDVTTMAVLGGALIALAAVIRERA
jgi:hypothetical protein